MPLRGISRVGCGSDSPSVAVALSSGPWVAHANPSGSGEPDVGSPWVRVPARRCETFVVPSRPVPGITRRIEREASAPDLAKVLGQLSPTDAQSLLLEASRRRASDLRPSRLLELYRHNRFSGPSDVDPRELLRWDLIAFEGLPPEFVALELAPVCPLGTVSSVTGLSQDWAVSTVRNTEVVSDSTNALALEHAVRRARAAPGTVVKLAASHRVLRGQRFENPGARPHFRLFSLSTGGRDTGNVGVELAALSEHVGFYLLALQRYLGPMVRLRVSFTEVGAISRHDRVETLLLAPLHAAFPSVDIGWDPARQAGRSYYRQLCYHIHAIHPDGRPRELVDGGDVDWAQKLLNNGKERLVVSGLGTEGLCRDFGAPRS